MCLYKIHKLPKIAWKPITCYKVVDKISSVNFATIYLGERYKLNMPIKASYFNLGISKKELTGEVVHAYTIESAAHKRANITCSASVLECVIPKFTIYWLGRYDEIGARKIIPLKFL